MYVKRNLCKIFDASHKMPKLFVMLWKQLLCQNASKNANKTQNTTSTSHTPKQYS